MQFSKWKIGAVALVCMLLPGSVHAQIVKNERLLSFEEKQVPAFEIGRASCRERV